MKGIDERVIVNHRPIGAEYNSAPAALNIFCANQEELGINPEERGVITDGNMQ
jgi:hypothetical protein